MTTEDRPTLTDEQLAEMRARDERVIARLGSPERDPLLRAEMDRRTLIAALTAERDAHAGEVERLRAERDEANEEADGWNTEAAKWKTRAGQAERQVREMRERIEALIAGADPHYDAAGFPDGYAVRVAKLRAALSGPTTEGASDG